MTASRPGAARFSTERSEVGDAADRAPGDVRSASPDEITGTAFPILKKGNGSGPTAAPRSRLRLPALLAIGLHVAVGTAMTALWVMEPAVPARPALAFVAVRSLTVLPPEEPEPEPPVLLPPTEAMQERTEPLDEAPLPVEVDPDLAAVPERAEAFEPTGPPAFAGPPVSLVRRRRTPPAPQPAPESSQAMAVTATGPTRGVALLEGGCPDPTYPRREKERGVQGTTRLKFLVAVDGSIEEVEIASSSGHDSLDEAARRAALQWRFLPALENGVAIPSWAWRDVRFILR